MNKFMEFTFLVSHKDQGVSFFHLIGYDTTAFREMEELVLDYLKERDDTVSGVSYVGKIYFSALFL